MATIATPVVCYLIPEVDAGMNFYLYFFTFRDSFSGIAKETFHMLLSINL